MTACSIYMNDEQEISSYPESDLAIWLCSISRCMNCGGFCCRVWILWQDGAVKTWTTCSTNLPPRALYVKFKTAFLRIKSYTVGFFDQFSWLSIFVDSLKHSFDDIRGQSLYRNTLLKFIYTLILLLRTTFNSLNKAAYIEYWWNPQNQTFAGNYYIYNKIL